MKKILLVLVIASEANQYVIAQAPVIQWQNTIGGNSTDIVYSIQQTADGGYILGGGSASDISGDKTENSIGGSLDYWIVKTDSAGNIQWQNTIGGGNQDVIYSIQQTADGGYILGGSSSSNISGDKTENNIGGLDYWLVKTDATGNIQWQNTIGGSSDDYLRSIQQAADGGYILGGYSYSNISGDKTENCIGSYDYWIVKTDLLGNIQWQNTIGGNSSEQLWFNSIQQTADGGYILGGYSASGISGDKTENSNGNNDFWIVKIDSAGNIQWQNTIGGNNMDLLQSIQQTSDGGYILGGYSDSNVSGDKTENSNGGNDYWIVKTDASGNIQWQNTIGGSSGDDLYCVQQTMDGGFFLGGFSFSGISGDKTENCIGNTDYWIVKTDSTGNVQWQNTIGGNNYDYLYDIRATADGYILCGTSSSNISGDKTENSIGGWDYWIVKLSDRYNLINGELFIDANSNTIRDAGELAVINRQVSEINTGSFAFSEQTGYYPVAVWDSGNYSVSPATLSYYAAVPASHSAYFSGIQQEDSLNDFAFQPAGVFNDLCAAITPLGPFRAGFNASYMINYENVGTTTLNPTIIFFPDSNLTYVSSNVSPFSVTTDSIAWSVGTIAPFQTGSIIVTITVNVGTPINTWIESEARIEPVAGDASPGCNYPSWRLRTIGSYDPNDIIVDEEMFTTIQLATQPHLEYVIRFQNTGNDTAFNVKVLNPIDTFRLRLNTLEFVASSHPVNMSWLPWERNMEFRFDNILLPDSNINEPGSHGFIRYRIKPNSTLSAGDSIVNYAAIYFDFNAAVITNNAVTNIALPTSILNTPYHSHDILLLPNPATSEIKVQSSTFNVESVEVWDVVGRRCLTPALSKGEGVRIDVSSLVEGIYFVKVRDEKGNVAVGKFVKE